MAETTSETFEQGQRVRHRYEHWWGTILRQADKSGGTAAVPAPVVYHVAIDGGKNRDDIRHCDLTLT